MAEPGQRRPAPVRFFLQLTVVLILAGLAAHRIFRGWQGPFKALKAPEPDLVEPLESERRGGPVAGTLAPPKPVRLHSRAAESPEVVPERLGKEDLDRRLSDDSKPGSAEGAEEVDEGTRRGGRMARASGRVRGRPLCTRSA
jgi:hypothetical protein